MKKEYKTHIMKEEYKTHKHQVGESVWVMKDNAPAKLKIGGFYIIVGDLNTYTVEYHLQNPGIFYQFENDYTMYDEDDLFKTKEELIASL